MQQGRLEDAEAESRITLALDPKIAIAHSTLGQILYVHQRHDDALAELRRAIELDPSNSSLHANLGTALRDLGQDSDAVAEYRKAVALDPGSPIFHALLGVLLSAKAEAGEAATEFHRALELDPRLAGDLSDSADYFMERAAKIGSSDLTNATLIDACWLLVAASRLAPTQDYSPALRRIDDKLTGPQHCPPHQAPAMP